MSKQATQRVMKELAKFPPSGSLMLRVVDDTNLFHQQGLIVGPSDSPYHGGFFLFDINVPAHTYPSGPPAVVIANTDGGKTRLNPNFYANGKICVTILNTFVGATAAWTPVQSLESVMLAIQSLMSEDPYHNEPGFEECERPASMPKGKRFMNAALPNGAKPCKAYRDKVRHEVLRVAVCEALATMAGLELEAHPPPREHVEAERRRLKQRGEPRWGGVVGFFANLAALGANVACSVGGLAIRTWPPNPGSMKPKTRRPKALPKPPVNSQHHGGAAAVSQQASGAPVTAVSSSFAFERTDTELVDVAPAKKVGPSSAETAATDGNIVGGDPAAAAQTVAYSPVVIPDEWRERVVAEFLRNVDGMKQECAALAKELEGQSFHVCPFEYQGNQARGVFQFRVVRRNLERLRRFFQAEVDDAAEASGNGTGASPTGATAAPE